MRGVLTVLARSDVRGGAPAGRLGMALACAALVIVAGLVLPGARALAVASPIVESESVSNVASTSATLDAQINPGGADTTYRFEYGTAAGSYTASAPVPDADAGAGVEAQAVSVHVQGLQAGMLYHYRVLATNALEVVDGSDRTFTTQPATSVSGLPDDRQYELVSPPSKLGAEALGIATHGAGNAMVESSEDGGAITYGMKFPPEAEAPANTLLNNQLISTRGAAGWSTQNITTPVVETSGLQNSSEFKAFTPDLTRSSFMRTKEPGTIQSLSPEAPEGIRILPFLRSESGAYTPLVTRSSLNLTGDRVNFVAATPDLSHVIIMADLTLLEGVPPIPVNDENYNTYEWTAGRLQLVNILPNGEEAAPDAGYTAFGGDGGFNVRHAISDDGSHVIWSYDGGVYERDMVTEKTVLVKGGGEFQTASSDGSKVFTSNANGDLYAFDAVTGSVTDLTGPGAEVTGVLGGSEDGSYVYFVAQGALSAAATAGSPNLYMAHYDGAHWTPPVFVATLSNSDSHYWEIHEKTQFLARLTAEVSPNGRYVAFMTEGDPTGYDNIDANSGQRDAEAYLYDAVTGHLSCASCNPYGARPTGEFDEGISMDPTEAWKDHWVAAGLPGWTPSAEQGQTTHQSRYVSNEGRLFFDSAEALVPQDTNGREDVYEFEQAGTGSCSEAAGCVALISSGAGSGDSSFVDASASGDDVFFRTQERLVSQDVDDAFDIYDAHVCSAVAPCPVKVVSPPPCVSSDECKAAPSPQPPIFGAPPSATFVGSGNVVQSTAARSVKAKQPITKREGGKEKGKRQRRGKKRGAPRVRHTKAAKSKRRAK